MLCVLASAYPTPIPEGRVIKPCMRTSVLAQGLRGGTYTLILNIYSLSSYNRYKIQIKLSVNTNIQKRFLRV